MHESFGHTTEKDEKDMNGEIGENLQKLTFLGFN